MERVENGNGTKTYYEYDAANRLLSITHKDGSANVLYKLDYTWNP